MSDIDPSKPTEIQATTKSVRDNFQAAANEIDANAAAIAELAGLYEAGNWTPRLTDGTNEPTYGFRVGRWARQGNMVTVQAYIQLSSKGALNGALRIDGLPVPADATAAHSFACGAMGGAVLGASTVVSGLLNFNVDGIELQVWDTVNGSVGFTASNALDGLFFGIGGTYIAAD